MFVHVLVIIADKRACDRVDAHQFPARELKHLLHKVIIRAFRKISVKTLSAVFLPNLVTERQLLF